MSRSLTLNLPDELYDSLEQQARIAGVSLHDWVVSVLSAHVGRGGASPPAAVDESSGSGNTAIDDDLQQS